MTVEERVAAAQERIAVENATSYLRGEVMPHFKVHSDEAPASIAYIHSLAARGFGSNYDWLSGEITVNITESDCLREPGFKNVRSVTLLYRATEPEQEQEDSYAG